MSLETLEKIIKAGTKLTPMMSQYYEIKKNYQDCILFFRMGDFYEVFFEDALLTTKILNIALTHRGKLGDTKIPMAGIPHHAAQTYVDRITVDGYKVAICEQVEDPKASKGIVKRAVTQVVSPGMPYDVDRTDSNETKFMASCFFTNDHYYLSAIDFTTGLFNGYVLETKEALLEKIRIISPKEFITYMGQFDHIKGLDTLFNHIGTLPTYLSEEYFTQKFTDLYIERLIPSYKRDKVLKLNSDILSPIGALSYYICSTQAENDFVHISKFELVDDKNQMKVTLPTLQGLEILPKNKEHYRESLLGHFDKTKTSLGSRMLREVFTTPLADIDAIKSRQKLVKYFIDDQEILENTREELSEIRDIERILSKISTGKINPNDIINIANSITAYQKIAKILNKAPKEVINLFKKNELSELEDIAETINKTINDEIGASLDKGNLIRSGRSKKRDKLAKLSTNAGQELLKLEESYRKKTGISKLKVKHNNVAGYFIEISKIHSNKVPKSFERRQTLVNAERYTTKELSEFEKEVVSAKDKLEKIEREILNEVISLISDSSKLLLKLAKTIAKIDVFGCFSWMAIQDDLVSPSLSTDKKILEIKGAWHPLIKTIIKDQFVAHDINLNEKQYFGLITGPNMAGKTTVMREMAIIQLLAQIGSFVPAISAELGVCDFLFSRLGASDDILKGQSTFMVEMAETAEILRHATDKSLIILDEVGRGTSTYDGLSIAWALVEHFISKTKGLTLFATHYHELVEVVDREICAKNLTVETKNNDGDVQFLYNLIEEGAGQSFGIYVAKLAGIPKSILKRSESILKGLEKKDALNAKVSHSEEITKAGTQLCIFDPPKEAKIPEYLEKIEDEISDLDLMSMTPIQAMITLDKLKKQVDLQ